MNQLTMLKTTLTFLLATTLYLAQAQTKVNPRPLTIDEYNKAKTFTVANLDKDTYVKFDNTYILDRYESRKPYFITGDDGLKKRIDLYKLIGKDGMQEIGLMVFYTNEKGTMYKTIVPDFTADGKVWEQYFLDIDNINKEEKNFILKLSYVLSKEMSFQQYKALNGGKDMKEEGATYGNDICFPGDEVVTMANGRTKMMKDVKSGEEIITIDVTTSKPTAVKVKTLTVHEAKNYALTRLVLVSAKTLSTHNGQEVFLTNKILQATPNHPMMTKDGNRKMGDVVQGQEVMCLNEKTGKYEAFTVLQKTEHADGIQKVYNIVADGGSTLLVNGVMVMQK
jgi:hypothetical protein